jgi:hypothetical protein
MAFRRPIWELSSPSRRTLNVSINANKNAITLALRMGFAVPFLYFGIQIAAAPFFPEYSFLARDASTLGSNASRLPALFNIGSLVVGIVRFIASWGFFPAGSRSSYAESGRQSDARPLAGGSDLMSTGVG